MRRIPTLAVLLFSAIAAHAADETAQRLSISLDWLQPAAALVLAACCGTLGPGLVKE